MLGFNFYTKNKETVILKVSDTTYEKLANMGMAKIVDFELKKIEVEGDEYEEEVATLDFESRKKIIEAIQDETHKELCKTIVNWEIPTLSIKDMREGMSYIKSLTELHNLIKDENNEYFSY